MGISLRLFHGGSALLLAAIVAHIAYMRTSPSLAKQLPEHIMAIDLAEIEAIDYNASQLGSRLSLRLKHDHREVHIITPLPKSLVFASPMEQPMPAFGSAAWDDRVSRLLLVTSVSLVILHFGAQCFKLYRWPRKYGTALLQTRKMGVSGVCSMLRGAVVRRFYDHSGSNARATRSEVAAEAQQLEQAEVLLCSSSCLLVVLLGLSTLFFGYALSRGTMERYLTLFLGSCVPPLVVICTFATPVILGAKHVTRPFLTWLNLIMSICFMWQSAYTNWCWGAHLGGGTVMVLPGSSSFYMFSVLLVGLRSWQVLVCSDAPLSTILQLCISLSDGLTHQGDATQLGLRGQPDLNSHHTDHEQWIFYVVSVTITLWVVTWCMHLRVSSEAMTAQTADRHLISSSLAGRVLRATCDACLRLDGSLALLEECPEFAGMLLHSEKPMIGRTITEFVAPEERQQVLEQAMHQAELVRNNPHCNAPAGAAHVRFKDVLGNTVNAELFWCCSVGAEGVVHLVGVKEEARLQQSLTVVAPRLLPANSSDSTDTAAVSFRTRTSSLNTLASVSEECSSATQSNTSENSLDSSQKLMTHSCSFVVNADAEGLELVSSSPDFQNLCGSRQPPATLAEWLLKEELDKFKKWLTSDSGQGTHMLTLHPFGAGQVCYTGSCQEAHSFGIEASTSAKLGRPRHILMTGIIARGGKRRQHHETARRRRGVSTASAEILLSLEPSADFFRIVRTTCRTPAVRDILVEGSNLVNMIEDDEASAALVNVLNSNAALSGVGLGPWRFSSPNCASPTHHVFCEDVLVKNAGVGIVAGEHASMRLARLELRGISIRQLRPSASTSVVPAERDRRVTASL